MAPGLDGVTNIAAITNPVVHGGTRGERSCLLSYQGLAPRVRYQLELLLEVSPLLPLTGGA
jgi:hypothetical protein